MAELADAHGSGPCESDFMQVQVLLSAPVIKSLQVEHLQAFYCIQKRECKNHFYIPLNSLTYINLLIRPLYRLHLLCTYRKYTDR